jgi:hypothetical protein
MEYPAERTDSIGRSYGHVLGGIRIACCLEALVK